MGKNSTGPHGRQLHSSGTTGFVDQLHRLLQVVERGIFAKGELLRRKFSFSQALCPQFEWLAKISFFNLTFPLEQSSLKSRFHVLEKEFADADT